jgi:hypothetical protein
VVIIVLMSVVTVRLGMIVRMAVPRSVGMNMFVLSRELIVIVHRRQRGCNPCLQIEQGRLAVSATAAGPAH